MLRMSVLPLFVFLIVLAVKPGNSISCGHLLEHLNGTADGHQELYDYTHLLCLIADRMKIGEEVAAIKWLNKTVLYDPEREKVELKIAVTKANGTGLSEQWTTTFFHDQMNANLKVQEHMFSLWKSNHVNVTLPPNVDLINTIRPELDKIDNQLLQLAKNTLSLRKSKWCSSLATELHSIIDLEFNFDVDEVTIYRQVALREICTT